MTFTTAQIAAALGITRQLANWHLRGVASVGVEIVRGKEAKLYELAQFPPALLALVESARVKGNYRTALDVFTNSRPLQPLPDLATLDQSEIAYATKLREAMEPLLLEQHKPGVSGREFKQRGVDAYRRAFGHCISTGYWWKLFRLVIDRDAGAENWHNLQIYVRPNPKLKTVEQSAPAITADTPGEFENLGALISQLRNPLSPSGEERKAIWAIAFQTHTAMIRAGTSGKSAARRLRDFLFERCKFLATTRHALRLKFDRKLAEWRSGDPTSLDDGRKNNGDVAMYPSEDIRRVRHSAVRKHEKRIDAAWREEYKNLSEYTRKRHPFSPRTPTAFYKKVNRIWVDALFDRWQKKRHGGKLRRDATGIPAMSLWVMDDMTSNIEVALQNRDGTWSLIQPQIITVMDSVSRKWVGWSMSIDQGPTIELVCAASLNALQNHGVPGAWKTEHGWVFGRALALNGKVDDHMQTIVAGLGQYGCPVSHFEAGNPTGKAELENSFNLFQRLMARHFGYGGRNQRQDASDEFKLQQRLIRSGRLHPSKCRYLYDQFVQVMQDMVDEYNNTPQFYGTLGGLTPNQAFEALKDRSNPSVKLDNRLLSFFLPGRTLVRVQPFGVRRADGGAFRYNGREVDVRGGELPQHIGQEFWAAIDPRDPTMVNFCSPDFSKAFVVEVSNPVPLNASRTVTGRAILQAERKKVAEHWRAIGDELKSLTDEFGDPRKDLLAKYSGQGQATSVPTQIERRIILNPKMESAINTIQDQRKAIVEKRQSGKANKARARRIGVHSSQVDESEQSRHALELLGDLGKENQ